MKRWLLGTQQGAVTQQHLDYYLDEFTFRFNRRRSGNRGKLFYRPAQHAAAILNIEQDGIRAHGAGQRHGLIAGGGFAFDDAGVCGAPAVRPLSGAAEGIV